MLEGEIGSESTAAELLKILRPKQVNESEVTNHDADDDDVHDVLEVTDSALASLKDSGSSSVDAASNSPAPRTSQADVERLKQGDKITVASGRIIVHRKTLRTKFPVFII